MDETISREALEKALWEWDSFSGDAAAHAALLTAIDTYAACQAELLRTHPTPLVENYLHLLITLAEHLLDSGGRVRLISERSELETREVPVVKALPSAKPGTFFNPDGTITCKDCGDAKDPEDFYRDQGKRTGRKSQCKQCARKAAA